MNFLGMGPLELVLIVVLALIVFGPAKLPEIMGQVGRAIGDFRRATSELSDEFNRTIQAELNETKATIDETKAALTDVRSAVDSSMKETQAAISGVAAPQRVATPSTLETPAANGTTHDDGATNGATTESSPPLADTAQWSWETSPAAPAVDAATVADDTTAPIVVDETSAPTVAEGLSGAPTADVEAEAAAPSEAPAQADKKDGPTPPQERVARDELQPPY
jgi:TatA/E family protein of Tat protein translocase